jgi:pyridoxamine 5'-phosphate oxidase
VRIEGTVERVSRQESEEYFRTRPRGAQLAAWASRQSEPVESREVLDARFAEIDREYPGEVPLPPHWGGYRLTPEVYEFWQHRENRFHDRLRYRRSDNGWTIDRLSP